MRPHWTLGRSSAMRVSLYAMSNCSSTNLETASCFAAVVDLAEYQLRPRKANEELI